MTDPAKLDSELGRGAMGELPPNIPPGFLGEVSPSMVKADEFEPTLMAGLTQEQTWETRWLLMAVLWMLVLTAPVAAWLLWREPKRAVWVKVAATVVGVAYYGVIWYFTNR
jgi:hypothetical protein